MRLLSHSMFVGSGQKLSRQQVRSRCKFLANFDVRVSISACFCARVFACIVARKLGDVRAAPANVRDSCDS